MRVTNNVAANDFLTRRVPGGVLAVSRGVTHSYGGDEGNGFDARNEATETHGGVELGRPADRSRRRPKAGEWLGGGAPGGS